MANFKLGNKKWIDQQDTSVGQRKKEINSVERPCSPWVLVAEWRKRSPCVRDVMRGLDSCRGLFLCPTIVSCWSIHLSQEKCNYNKLWSPTIKRVKINWQKDKQITIRKKTGLTLMVCFNKAGLDHRLIKYKTLATCDLNVWAHKPVPLNVEGIWCKRYLLKSKCSIILCIPVSSYIRLGL